jgi:hypothetical protein
MIISRRAEQMIMIPEYGYGITLIDNDIVLGNIGVIYIINREGERLNTIKVGKGTMYSIWVIQSILLLQHDTFVFPVWCKTVQIV